MVFTCLAHPLECEAWWCGKLRIALSRPFFVVGEVPEGFDSVTWGC